MQLMILNIMAIKVEYCLFIKYYIYNSIICKTGFDNVNVKGQLDLAHSHNLSPSRTLDHNKNEIYS